MNHQTVRNKLIFYLEERLPGDEQQKVADHLADCGECRRYFELLKGELQLLDGNRQQEAGPYFYAGIKNRIEARKSCRSFPWQRALQPVMLALLLAVGIRFGIWVGNHAQAELSTTEQAVLVPFDDLSEEPIEEFLLNVE
ncbi:anti-sigma factor family protein [Mangrovibacterium lignilyticum]|uniref:anti-sigma factor family protein n=1 Tax=Mangrovibacterium lignilyticum TaxID=2668052 RepID=UPI0013D7C755|nr:zf-HC2 domain-containing protein [Mangrovibacterium lignilyticum]